MTVYNARPFLERSVSSIVAQSYRDWELVAVDDGSNDGSFEYLAELAQHEPRIVVFRPGRLGRYPALTYGLNQCRGELVAIMDADDYSYPERLERQVAHLNAHPDVAGLGTGYWMVNEFDGTREARTNPASDAALRRALGAYIPICHTSGMFRRVAAMQSGGYLRDATPPYRSVEDLRVWINLAREHRLANLPDLLVDHFLHPRSYGWDGQLVNHLALAKVNAYAIRELRLPPGLYLGLPAHVVYGLLPKAIKRWPQRLLRKAFGSQTRSQR
jgi:glycosyltransferase involved in cell wall biosynthesis